VTAYFEDSDEHIGFHKILGVPQKTERKSDIKEKLYSIKPGSTFAVLFDKSF
jgi:hypothetical protein